MSSEHPAPTVIEVRNLSKSFSFTHKHEWTLIGKPKREQRLEGVFKALDDVNFVVRRGETVGVLGRNGAGKSTLLQVLTGVLQPTSGSVIVAGRVGALLELGAGFNHELTGRENITLSGAVLGMSSREVDSKMEAIERFADIGEFIDHPVKTYSSGMLVRLAFSLQVHLEPDVLIIDEALSVGDMFFQQKCLSKIREIIANGVTVFFVSHSLNAVKSICDRAILLEHGRVAADGRADEVCEAYQNSMSSTSRVDLANALSRAALASAEGAMFLLQDMGEEIMLRDPGFSSRLSSRSGGGEAVFTGFAVLRDRSTPVISIERASKVTLRLQFHARQDLPPGAAIGLLIRDAHGVDLVAFNSNFYGKSLPALSAGSTYIWELDVDLPLAQGRYSFHCGLKPDAESSYFYDRCFNIGVLDIESNPVSWGQYGGRLLHAPERMAVTRISG